MQPSPRERWFDRLSHLTTHRTKTIVIGAFLFFALSVSFIPGLKVSTSRQGLVERENPYQKRLLEFRDRFGDPTSPVFFVISGGNSKDRQDTVDQLVDSLSAESEFKNKIIARMGPEQVAEALLLQSPQATRELRALAPTDVDMSSFVEGGLPAYAKALRERLSNLAAALQMKMLMPFGASVSTSQVNQVLQNIESLARTTDAYLAGKPPWAHINLRPKSFSMVDSAGYIVGQDSQYLLVSVFPDFGGDEVHQQKPIIEKLRKIRDSLLDSRSKNSSVKVQLTGLPALAVDELQIIEEGLSKSSMATGIGVFILFLLAFRSVRQSVVAAIPLILGIASTLAFVRLVYGQLNLITSSFISVLLGLGIDFPVHFLGRFNEARRKNHSVQASLGRSLSKTGPGILTGAVTTILAFLTTTTTEFTAFAELGIITAVGLTLMVLATFLVLPALIFHQQSKHQTPRSKFPQLTQLMSVVRKAPRLLLAAGIIAAIFGAISLDKIQFNYRYFDFLPQETESSQALQMLENDLTMGPTFANISAKSVEDARVLATKLRQLPSVGSVQTATDLLPALDKNHQNSLKQFFAAFPRVPDFSQIAKVPISTQTIASITENITTEVTKIKTLLELTGQDIQSSDKAIEALLSLQKRIQSMGTKAKPLLMEAQSSISNIAKKAWHTARDISERGNYLPSDIPDVLKQRFVSKAEDALALYVYPKGDIWDRQFATQFANALEEIEPNVSGFAITLHAHSNMILSGFKRAALIAAILIWFLLLYDFRKISDALLALIPTTLGWLWMLGIMSMWNIKFNVANIVVLPLVLGIGIDAGVHMVHRYRESSRANNVAQLSDLLSGTGSAVLLSSITTIVGFAGLMLADYGGMQSLGLVMVLGISSCLAACLLILPAILIILKKAE